MNVTGSLKRWRSFAKLGSKITSNRTYIASAKFSKDNLLVEFEGARSEVYPLVWLRDNCTCRSCYDQTSHSRIIKWKEFNVGVSATTLQVNKDAIQIVWNDDHKSFFAHDWLEERGFSKERQEKHLKDNYSTEKVLWERLEFDKIFKKHKYNDVMTKDDKLLRYLQDLSRYGVVLLKDAPLDTKECLRLARRIAFIRKTQYAEDFVVTSETKAKRGTSHVVDVLQFHTDFPYYHYIPGTTFLHCIVQSESNGGGNLLSDGFFVSEELRRRCKRYFDLLTSVDVNWSDYGEEDNFSICKLYKSPIIRLDPNNQVSCVRLSVSQRDSFFTVDVEKVKPWYCALSTFVQLLYQHASCYKLVPGDILAFDNTRIVHERQKYEDTDKNQRCLVGMHIDWDEILCKIRILQRRLQAIKT